MHPTVLIVDDQHINRQRLSAAATTAGFRVADQCTNAQEALHAFSRLRPQIVLMDVNLPGDMDGLAASAVILDMAPGTLVVACSAFLDPRGMHDAFAVGVHRCLRKPIRMEEALRLFENLHEELEVQAAS